MLFLLSYAFQGIGSCYGNLFLNAPDALFLPGSQVKTSVQGVGAAPVDLNKLLLIEDLLFGDEAGADGEILLGACIVFLKVIALVEARAVLTARGRGRKISFFAQSKLDAKKRKRKNSRRLVRIKCLCQTIRV